MAEQPAFPSTVTATIELRDGGIVVVAEDGTVDTVRVAAGGTVEFVTAADSPFQWWSILWKSETPFDDGKGWASEGRGRRKSKKIGARAHGGGTSERSYSYAVVASDGSQVYFRDPEVVVGPP